MASRKATKKTDHKKESSSVSEFLKRAETELVKKESELIKVKERHRKLAGEFIDLWIKVRRLKRSANSNLELKW